MTSLALDCGYDPTAPGTQDEAIVRIRFGLTPNHVSEQYKCKGRWKNAPRPEPPDWEPSLLPDAAGWVGKLWEGDDS